MTEQPALTPLALWSALAIGFVLSWTATFGALVIVTLVPPPVIDEGGWAILFYASLVLGYYLPLSALAALGASLLHAVLLLVPVFRRGRGVRDVVGLGLIVLGVVLLAIVVVARVNTSSPLTITAVVCFAIGSVVSPVSATIGRTIDAVTRRTPPVPPTPTRP